MVFEKSVLAEIEKCYAVAGMEADGKTFLIFAGEGNGSVHIFSGEDFKDDLTLTDGGGGTMSIVPLPEKPGWFLLSRGFYSMVDSSESVIELVRYRGGTFEPPVKIMELPYLHRFGVVHGKDGTAYIAAASLHSFKKDKEDWSTPGHVYWAALPDDLDGDFSLEPVPFDGDFYMNHGFCTGIINGQETAFTSSREGVFTWLPPDARGGAWNRGKLMDIPVSDIAVQDIDGDGQAELAVLLPFHGDQCKVFHRSPDGYVEIYTSPEDNDFYHAILGAEIDGRKVFVGGARKGVMDLFILYYDSSEGLVKLQQVDAGVGPSNVSVLNSAEGDMILSANRMVAEACCYRLTGI